MRKAKQTNDKKKRWNRKSMLPSKAYSWSPCSRIELTDRGGGRIRFPRIRRGEELVRESLVQFKLSKKIACMMATSQ